LVYGLYSEGPPLEDCDLITASVPLALARRGHPLATAHANELARARGLQRATAHAKELDRPLLQALERTGFRLDDGEDGTGWQFKYLTRGGGYYFNVGCFDLIVKGEIAVVEFSDIPAFVDEGAQMRTGETLAADLIVLATGYKGQEYLVSKLF